MAAGSRSWRQAITLVVAPLAVVAATAAVVVRLGSAATGSDGDGPTVTVLTPAEGAHLPLGPIEVTARVDDPDGVEYVELNVDDLHVARTQVNSLPTTTVTFMWRSDEPRVHRLALRAGDVHGSSGDVRRLQITVGPADPEELRLRLDTLATTPPPQHAARRALDVTPVAATSPPPASTLPTSPPTSLDPTPTLDLASGVVRRTRTQRPRTPPAVVTTPRTLPPSPTPVPEPAAAPPAVVPAVPAPEPAPPPAPPPPAVTVPPPPTTTPAPPTDDGDGGRRGKNRDDRRDKHGRGGDDGDRGG
jgi:hypothetical protein